MRTRASCGILMPVVADLNVGLVSDASRPRLDQLQLLLS
jgi:hypothetical protein